VRSTQTLPLETSPDAPLFAARGVPAAGDSPAAPASTTAIKPFTRKPGRVAHSSVDCRVDPREQCFPMIPAGAAALDLIEYAEPEEVAT